MPWICLTRDGQINRTVPLHETLIITFRSDVQDLFMAESYTHPDRFVRRHIGPAPADIQSMLKELDHSNLSGFSSSIVPDSILHTETMNIPEPLSESEVLSKLKSLASKRFLRIIWAMDIMEPLLPELSNGIFWKIPVGILNIHLISQS